MDPNLLPSKESLERARQADEIEVKPCQVCGAPCSTGERALRITAPDSVPDNVEWFHYWHVEEQPVKK